MNLCNIQGNTPKSERYYFYAPAIILAVILSGCATVTNPAQQVRQESNSGGHVFNYDPLADEFGAEFR